MSPIFFHNDEFFHTFLEKSKIGNAEIILTFYFFIIFRLGPNGLLSPQSKMNNDVINTVISVYVLKSFFAIVFEKGGNR